MSLERGQFFVVIVSDSGNAVLGEAFTHKTFIFNKMEKKLSTSQIVPFGQTTFGL
jgi:hypothetical protein